MVLRIDDYLCVLMMNSCHSGCCDWWAQKYKRVALLEFDRGRKSMSVIVRSTSTGQNRLLVKVRTS